jgi:DNA-binding NarL/FixJ family response regulator
VTCTVLVVDDHAEFRSVVRSLLQAEGFDVVGEAADAQEALDSVIRLRPEVVLLDVLLPGLDGFAVAGLLAATGPTAPDIVLVSSRPASAFRRRLVSTPARGFLSKADLTGPALRLLLDRG